MGHKEGGQIKKMNEGRRDVNIRSVFTNRDSDQRKQTGPEPSKLEASEGVRRQCMHATLKEERLLVTTIKLVITLVE